MARLGSTLRARPCHVASCLDAELREQGDDGLFEAAEVEMQVAPMSFEGHDGVGHELAGSMPGDIAAALHLDHGDVASVEHVGGGAPRASDRQGVAVLQQQDGIGDPPGDASGEQAELGPVSDRVVDGVDDVDDAGIVALRDAHCSRISLLIRCWTSSAVPVASISTMGSPRAHSVSMTVR
jgi:hypothetical protein